MSKLYTFKKKVISIEEIESLYKVKTYRDLWDLVNKLQTEEKLSPVKSSGGNGKSPTLFKKYRILEVVEDHSDYYDEINFKLSTLFSVEYYKSHIEKYRGDREYILKLNDFLKCKKELLKKSISMNERSFQIWGREKYLQSEGGKTLLKNLGLGLEFLNIYDTSEPLAYYSKDKEFPQRVLIIENKDTYYTFRRHLIEGGEGTLLDGISTVIYGGGKNIKKALNDFDISVESHVCCRENEILYFGDLDYEGIVIYEGICRAFREVYDIKAFVLGYEKMLDKVRCEEINLPKTKEGQNRNISNIFLDEFSEEYRGEIEDILERDLYIPQEIINIWDL